MTLTPAIRPALLALALLSGCAGTKYRPYAELQLGNHRHGQRSYVSAGVSVIAPNGLIIEAGPVLTFRPEDVGDGRLIQDRSAGVRMSVRWVR